MRVGMRVGHGCDHQCRAAHQRQARFHHVAADDAVAFGGARPRFQGIDDEAFEKIAAALRIEGLPPRPQFLKMPAVHMLGDVVDHAPAGLRRPARRIDVGARRQDQRLDSLGPRCRHLDGNDRPSVMARYNGAGMAERRQHVVRGLRPGLDGIGAGRQGLRIAEAHGIHGDGAMARAEQRQHLAVFVPGSRRLMQQQDRSSGAASRDMHKAGFDADERTFDHRHYGVRAEKGDGNEE